MSKKLIQDFLYDINGWKHGFHIETRPWIRQQKRYRNSSPTWWLANNRFVLNLSLIPMDWSLLPCVPQSYVRLAIFHSEWFFKEVKKFMFFYRWVRLPKKSEYHDVSNDWHLYCLFNSCSVFYQCKKKIHITDPLWGVPPVTGGFSSQRASNLESISQGWF